MNEIKACVQKVVANGRHGPYAVAVLDSDNVPITFSLLPPVWQDAVNLEPGTMVLLSDIRRKRAGWRAMAVRLMRPSDEKTSKEQGEKND